MCVYMYICVCAFTGIETYEDIYSQSLLFSESIFANSPDHQNLFVISKSTLMVLSQSFVNMGRAAKKIQVAIYTFPQMRSEKAMLCLFVSILILSYCKQGSFCHLFKFLCLMLVISLFKMASGVMLESCLVLLNAKKL